jgi:hypothetical protein
MDIICRLLGIIALRVSSPFDEILQGATAPKVLMIADSFDLILCSFFD